MGETIQISFLLHSFSTHPLLFQLSLLLILAPPSSPAEDQTHKARIKTMKEMEELSVVRILAIKVDLTRVQTLSEFVQAVATQNQQNQEGAPFKLL